MNDQGNNPKTMYQSLKAGAPSGVIAPNPAQATVPAPPKPESLFHKLPRPVDCAMPPSDPE